MSKKLVTKKASVLPSKTEEMLSEFSIKYEIPLPKLQEAHKKIMASMKSKRNVEDRAIIKLLGQLREGKLVDTEPVSFVLLGLTGLNDSKDFQVKEVTKWVKKEVPKVAQDLVTKGLLGIGYPIYKSAAGPEATLNVATTVYHPDHKERAIKECGESNLLSVAVDGFASPVLVSAIDKQETFAKSGSENPNYNKPVLHNYSRRYIGIAVRQREEPDAEGGRSFVPSFITNYGTQAKEFLPLHRHIDYDAKVTDITNDQKEVEMYAISVPEYSEATKVYEKGEASEYLGESWLINDDDDVAEILYVIDSYYENGRVVDYDKIQQLFANQKDWKAMIKETIPRVFSGVFTVAGRSQGAIFADTIAGSLIDAGKDPKDLRNAPRLSFQTCSNNPLAQELNTGDVIKPIFYFDEGNKYDFDLRVRTQEREPVVYLLGWSWEHKAGSESFIQADEVSS
ncbi:hypothetical protein LCGC14_0268030 [marine sediment metagenome]|uniref:Uncharacterized protein n=1 Tax=marine sediment metagenome TaxID=412755 RepID=A0A0F9UGY6_9ZZZZ